MHQPDGRKATHESYLPPHCCSSARARSSRSATWLGLGLGLVVGLGVGVGVGLGLGLGLGLRLMHRASVVARPCARRAGEVPLAHLVRRARPRLRVRQLGLGQLQPGQRVVAVQQRRRLLDEGGALRSGQRIPRLAREI